MSAVAQMAPDRPLSRLESAGWAELARELLSIAPGDARLLRRLAVEAPGRFVESETLDQFFPDDGRRSQPARKRMSVHMARIRQALTDLGFPPAVIENDPLAGYAVPVRFARQIRQLVEAAA